MTHEIIVRGVKRGVLVWKKTIVVDEAKLDEVIPDLVAEHTSALASGTVGMIEMEFVGMPEEDRYFRIGVEPHGMVQPLRVNLNDPLCHCGLPLHYNDPGVRLDVEEIVRERGEYMRVTVGARTWLVQRHYIALHGIKADELPTLGFREITNG